MPDRHGEDREQERGLHAVEEGLRREHVAVLVEADVVLGRPGNGGLRKKPRYTLCTNGQNTNTPKMTSDGISSR